jgi:hypothetical protein
MANKPIFSSSLARDPERQYFIFEPSIWSSDTEKLLQMSNVRELKMPDIHRYSSIEKEVVAALRTLRTLRKENPRIELDSLADPTENPEIITQSLATTDSPVEKKKDLRCDLEIEIGRIKKDATYFNKWVVVSKLSCKPVAVDEDRQEAISKALAVHKSGDLTYFFVSGRSMKDFIL